MNVLVVAAILKENTQEWRVSRDIILVIFAIVHGSVEV